MKPSSTPWLLRAAQRTSRNRAALALLVAVGCVGWLGSNHTYFREFLRGPTLLTAQRLERLSVHDEKAPHWVRVPTEKVLDTGVQEITERRRSRTISGHYFLAKVGERPLLLKAHGEARPAGLVEGELRELNPSAVNAVFKGSNAENTRALLLPMQLDVRGFRDRGWWMLAIGGGLLLASAWWGLLAWGRWRNPLGHPSIERAAGWGKLPVVAKLVQREMRAPEALRLREWTLTENHLVRDRGLNFDLHNLNDLLWAHPQVTKKKLYYVIPAGESHALVLKWREVSITLPGKEDEVLRGLEAIAQHQPWIMLGWNERFETLYDRQRAQMAREVQKNRQRWQAEQAAPAVAASPAGGGVSSPPLSFG